MIRWSSSPFGDRDRGLSPVVGGALLVAIVILLSVLASALAFGLLTESSPAPTTRFELDDGTCGHELRHVAGDRIDGDRIELDGADDPVVLAGRNLTAGDRQRIDAVDDEIAVVWRAEETDDSYVLDRFETDTDAADGPWGCPGTVYTANTATIDSVDGDGGAVETLSATADAQALGPTLDLTADGTADVPFVDGDGELKLTNSTNGTTTLADGSTIPGDIEHAKTRLGVGSWDGSDRSVFFVNENHDTLYRVTPSGTPVAVASPGNGVQAISGIGDVDGDGTDELVFADASQQLRYLEPDGTTKNVDDGQTGSNNGIGAGALADIDDDGTVSVVVVDGSNDVKITGEPTASGGEGTTTLTAPDAVKAPPTVADVDGDGDGEIVYVGLADGKLKYVDDVRDGNDVRYLEDDDGNEIDGSDSSGLV
jgi:flagellin-like protein